ncbi:MAG: zinc ribbon domain-containing protein [Thermoplasmata archaeon]
MKERTTTRDCSICEPLTRKEHCITMICEECSLIIDRDVNAAINIARRGRTRLTRSFHEMEKGQSSEAMKQSKDVKQMIASQILSTMI